MAAITTLSACVNYCKKMLGRPVINVEVSDDQFEQIIEDSVQDFQRYTYGEATYRDVLILSLSAGTSAYQLDQSIDSILDIKLTFGSNGINDLFTAQHNLLYNTWIQGNYPGGSGGGSNGPAGLGGSMTMANYDTAMIYLKEIEDHFQRKYTCDFNPNSYVLRVWPTPNVTSNAMLTIFKKEEAVNLYNNSLFKKLVVARSRIMWGNNIGKNIITLPGGGTTNGDAILAKGEKDEESALQNIKLETEPPIFMVG